MLQPLRGKILVKVLEDNKRTESGIILAGQKEEVPHRGIIIALGSEFIDRKGRTHKWGIQPNHIVHFSRRWDGLKTSHQILRRDQIYAIEFQDKVYAISDFIIVKKVNEVGDGLIYVPKHFESEVSKQIDYGIVLSVGKEDRLGINIGDKIVFWRNEGLSVKIPLQEEVWSLRPRCIVGKVIDERNMEASSGI